MIGEHFILVVSIDYKGNVDGCFFRFTSSHFVGDVIADHVNHNGKKRIYGNPNHGHEDIKGV